MDEYLTYGDEETDAEPLITAVYSREWLSHLLGVVSILEQPELWATPADMDDVLVQVNDLIARLMGGDPVGGIYYGGLPYFVPATALPWNPDLSPTKLYNNHNFPFSQVAYTDATDEVDAICHFSVALPAGDFIVDTIYSKGPDRGKFKMACTVEPSVYGVVDAYAVSYDYGAVISAEIENDEPRLVIFEYVKQLKNPSASGNYFVLCGAVVREKTVYD